MHGAREAGAPWHAALQRTRASSGMSRRVQAARRTARAWRALALGCIPVTFFRAAGLPSARRLGLDYARFTVNVQPDDYLGLQACARAPRVALGTPMDMLSSWLSLR